MTATAAPQSATGDWKKDVKPFRTADTRRSVWQLVNTLVPYFALWGLMIWSLEYSYLITLALAVVAGGLTVRLFIINHDCGHQSFFKSRRANDIVGFWTAVLVVTPYQQWRHGHAIHHAKSGKVEDRGVGYFWIMSRQEYLEASPGKRLWCRIYRNPFVLFIVGGMYLFLIEFRFSLGSDTKKMQRQVWATNLVLALITVGMGQWIGYWNFLSIALPVVGTAATTGLWLFFLQHHYEDSYWGKGDDWSYERAALEGSSYIKMNPILEWFAGYINYHHIHHLVPKVPNYKLREAHYAVPTFRAVEPLTWAQIKGSWRLRLVDEETLKWTDFPSAEEVAAYEASKATAADDCDSPVSTVTPVERPAA